MRDMKKDNKNEVYDSRLYDSRYSINKEFFGVSIHSDIGCLKCPYGVIKAYDRAPYLFEANVAITSRNNSNITFRVLEVIRDDFYFPLTSASCGNKFVLDTYEFEEASEKESERLSKIYEKILGDESISTWKFDGYILKMKDGEPSIVKGTSIHRDIGVDEALSIEDAVRISYERFPLHFFCSTIERKFVDGDYAVVPLPDYYMKRYGVNDELQALLALGKETGWDTSKVEKIMKDEILSTVRTVRKDCALDLWRLLESYNDRPLYKSVILGDIKFFARKLVNLRMEMYKGSEKAVLTHSVPCGNK